jgi:hypothetical protein
MDGDEMVKQGEVMTRSVSVVHPRSEQRSDMGLERTGSGERKNQTGSGRIVPTPSHPVLWTCPESVLILPKCRH